LTNAAVCVAPVDANVTVPLAAGVTWENSPEVPPLGSSSTTQFEPVGTFWMVVLPVVDGALMVMSSSWPGCRS
jgi:hypothetical protein